MKITKILFLSFCLCLGAIVATAQYRIDQWTADDGLPQNSVYGIVQTGDGYLWLATLDGLARFDGVRFTVFNKSNSPGIINNRFTALFTDARGDLWAGTETSGIIGRHNRRFNRYNVGENEWIDWIDADADGNPMTLSTESKAFHFTGGQFTAFNARLALPAASNALPQQNAKAKCLSDVSTNSVNCYANGQRAIFPAEKTPSDDRLFSAAQDANGNFWLIADRRELMRFENGNVVRIDKKSNGLPEIPLDFVTGAKLSLISWDGKDSIWLTDLSTMRSELLLKTPAAAATLTGDIYPPFTTEYNIFQSAYQDGEGNLWFGTLRAGLYRARRQIVTAYSTEEGLTDNNVYPIFEDDDGSLLVGTTSGLFSFQNGRFSPVESPKSPVFAIGINPEGQVVFSIFGELYALEANRTVPFLRGKIPEQKPIHAIHTDRENTFWLGSENGLIRYKDEAATVFTTDEGLAGNDVKVIIDARAGGLWIGTYGGLSRWQNGQLTGWTENDGLPSSTIRALYEDEDNALWIGSYDGGLTRFKDGKFTHYNTKIGLYNDGAFQILEGENDDFWISSNHGIYRVSKNELNEYADGKRQTITSINYGKSDGMLNAEGNGGRSPAGIKTGDGRLWFPTQDGVAMIDPREIKINAQPPPVVIENVKIDNREIAFENADLGLDSAEFRNSNPEPQIQLAPSEQSFEITYTALSFINSANLRFRYRLEGLDDDWTDAGTRRLAYYSHVPPGAYTFRVIAANSDGVWNETGAALRIVVLPPFYRTWWFLTLGVLGIGAAAFLLLKRRDSQIKAKHDQELAFSRRLIDSQEQERKRFAAEMHDGLGQSLVIIKNRAGLSLRQADQQEAMLDHLQNISATASHAIQEAKEIAFNLRPHLLDRLGLTKTIESMLDKVFGASGIEFQAEIEQIDDVLEKDSEILLYRIVQECANNIVKHSGAKRAFLKIHRGEGNLFIEISDNGRGFDPAATDEDLAKRSFGLVGISERTRLLGGKLNIASEPGKGTTVTVVIDL